MKSERVLITGASSGIGRSTALEFAKNKAELILLARRLDRLEVVKEECLKQGSPKVLIYQLDLLDSNGVIQFFKDHESEMNSVTVLVNNAGLALGLSSFQDSSFLENQTMIRTNLEAAVAVVQGMLPYFVKKKAGHIIQIGSVAGRWIYPKGHVYCATKAALKAFNEGLRLDLNGLGIRVSEIVPGMVETEFSVVRFKGDDERAKSVYSGIEALTPEDIAESIVWICQRPRHVNIQELVLYPTEQASPTVVHRK
jgi:3-hydroxy acid dehydrogenase / malonic semialdehyde reductase